MTTTGSPLRPVWRGAATVLRAPWTAEPWLATAQVLVGFPLAVVAFAVVAFLVATASTLAVTVVLAIPFLVALYPSCRMFTAWQLARLRGMRGIVMPEVDEPGIGATWLSGLWAQTRAPGTWRQIAYHLLSGVVSPVSVVVVAGAWAVGAALAAVPLYAWALPARALFDLPMHQVSTIGLVTILGLVLFLAAPWLAVVAAQLDVALAVALLAPSRAEMLAREVHTLSRSRSEVIDAADDDRRRIERDLHDGTQQRLVSLAMNLGLARTTLTDVPEGVRDAIEQAHEEAKLALSELRDVVRGLHPAILDDLGLDAALSGIAARSSVPVRLMVELRRRPPRGMEAAAYFVVSEALTNVAKHAEATQVDVVVELADDNLLRIIVSDNGRGGADPSRGSGLRGLSQRIRALNGGMTMESPPGGPTLLVVELPCNP